MTTAREGIRSVEKTFQPVRTLPSGFAVGIHEADAEIRHALAGEASPYGGVLLIAGDVPTARPMGQPPGADTVHQQIRLAPADQGYSYVSLTQKWRLIYPCHGMGSRMISSAACYP